MRKNKLRRILRPPREHRDKFSDVARKHFLNHALSIRDTLPKNEWVKISASIDNKQGVTYTISGWVKA